MDEYYSIMASAPDNFDINEDDNAATAAIITTTTTTTLMEAADDEDSSPSCQVAPSLQIFQSAFLREFQSTRAIDFSHRGAPRFGNTANISALMATNNPDERVSYLKGLVSGSMALFALFLVWSCVLGFMRIRGPKKYGWLSGSRIPLAAKQEHRNSEEDRLEKHQVEQKPVDISDIPHETATDVNKEEEEEEEERTSMPGNAQEEEWETTYEKLKKQDRRMKCVVFAASVGIVVSSIMMVTKG